MTGFMEDSFTWLVNRLLSIVSGITWLVNQLTLFVTRLTWLVNRFPSTHLNHRVTASTPPPHVSSTSTTSVWPACFLNIGHFVTSHHQVTFDRPFLPVNLECNLSMTFVFCLSKIFIWSQGGRGGIKASSSTLLSKIKFNARQLIYYSYPHFLFMVHSF